MRHAWTRQDSIVVLAAYVDRPPGLHLMPREAMQRVANLLGVPLDAVRARMRAFAALDPDNPVQEEQVPRRERRLWDTYRSRLDRLWDDADAILQERRLRPHPLWRA